MRTVSSDLDRRDVVFVILPVYENILILVEIFNCSDGVLLLSATV